ncbi:MAG TPA: Na+/H+ antiporter subunit B [Anaerolineae bacterium]|jgi:multicomponent Na+:H+ antiporter subunit B|nr:Na+/H+ antiporter subunit B [Anaerolineae bacterium]
MKDLILPTATAYLMPVLLLFSLFLLLRGHNEPGGGFAGGLVAATAFVLLSIAAGVDSARRALGVDPRTLVGGGLLLMLLSGLVAPLVYGEPYLTAHWWSVTLGAYDVSVGTPLLFDIGVYLGVAGTILLITFSLEEEGA